MKTLTFNLISDSIDTEYGPEVDSFELELKDEEAAYIEELAKELGEVTEEDLEERNPELSETISEEVWDILRDALTCQGYGWAKTDVLDPDMAEDFDEDKYNEMDFREGAEYIRKFGGDIEMVDVECTFSYTDPNSNQVVEDFQITRV